MLAVFIEYQNITDGQTNGGTDGQTDRFAISILRVSVRMHDNEYMHCSLLGIMYRQSFPKLNAELLFWLLTTTGKLLKVIKLLLLLLLLCCPLSSNNRILSRRKIC